MRTHIIGLNCRYTHSCLALFYVRCALEWHLPGSAVSIRQYTINDPYYDTLLRLSSSLSDALLFSAYIWNGMYIERLVRDLAGIRPDRPLILGGPQASSLKDLPEQCTVIDGEIEGVDERFYQDLEQRLPAAEIYGRFRQPFSVSLQVRGFFLCTAQPAGVLRVFARLSLPLFLLSVRDGP